MEKGTAVLDAGTRLGEYEIERLLGVGSMGAVYEAVCTATSQRHAIKVLSPALAALPSARARFLNEAKLTARVRHPHIVDVSDVGEDAGRIYFVMELLNGEDLARRLQRSGALSVIDTADIMLPVCDAVAEAHRRGVTHRDLKPSNVFLLVRGRRPHPVVLDFGIATDTQEEAPRAVSAAGAAPARRTVFGTPYYLAPEQVANHEAAGPASDQYALGVILYECLTGQPPYRGDNVDQVFRAITAGNLVPPIVLRPNIPAELNALVARALSTDPKARFFSVAELRQALVPFSSRVSGPTATLFGRPPISPAIAVEAATPTPYVRTLTPEVQAVSGSALVETAPATTTSAPPAVAVPEAAPALHLVPAPAAVAEAAPPSGIGIEGGLDVDAWMSTESPAVFHAFEEEKPPLISRKIWIGGGAAVALSGLVLALVAARGGSSDPQASDVSAAAPAMVTVKSEPVKSDPVKPPPESVQAAAPAAAPAPVAAPVPLPTEEPVAAAPKPAPREEPPPVAAAPREEPPVAPAPREEPPPVAATPKPAPREQRPAVAPAAKRASREEPMPATTAPSDVPAPPAGDAPAAAPKRKPSDKPRARPSGGVRMHNGVPLLD